MASRNSSSGEHERVDETEEETAQNSLEMASSSGEHETVDHETEEETAHNSLEMVDVPDCSVPQPHDDSCSQMEVGV